MPSGAWSPTAHYKLSLFLRCSSHPDGGLCALSIQFLHPCQAIFTVFRIFPARTFPAIILSITYYPSDYGLAPHPTQKCTRLLTLLESVNFLVRVTIAEVQTYPSIPPLLLPAPLLAQNGPRR